MRHKWYPLVLFILYVFLWILLALKPTNRFDWLLENLLVFVSLPLIIVGYRRRIFSNLSYTFLFVFLFFHALGSHFTYSEVPIDIIPGIPIYGRNHYDRFVHFTFGLLIFLPAREFFKKLLSLESFWYCYLPLTLIITLGSCYELIEWIIAMIVAPEAGIAYLGIQGDYFDAQKDLGWNVAGAFVAMVILLLHHRFRVDVDHLTTGTSRSNKRND